jgi:hypothetical protein
MTKEKYTRGKLRFAFLVVPYVHKGAQWGQIENEKGILISKQVLTICFVGFYSM